MHKNGLAIILGGPKSSEGKKKKEHDEDEGEDKGTMYEMAGKELLTAIKDDDAKEVASIIAEICRYAKSEERY